MQSFDSQEQLKTHLGFVHNFDFPISLSEGLKDRNNESEHGDDSCLVQSGKLSSMNEENKSDMFTTSISSSCEQQTNAHVTCKQNNSEKDKPLENTYTELLNNFPTTDLASCLDKQKSLIEKLSIEYHKMKDSDGNEISSSEMEKMNNSVANLQKDLIDFGVLANYTKMLCDNYSMLMTIVLNGKRFSHCGLRQSVSCASYPWSEQLTALGQFLNMSDTKRPMGNHLLGTGIAETDYLAIGVETVSEERGNTDEYMDMSSTCSDGVHEDVDRVKDKISREHEDLYNSGENPKNLSTIHADTAVDLKSYIDSHTCDNDGIDSDSTEANSDDFDMKPHLNFASIIRETEEVQRSSVNGLEGETKGHAKSEIVCHNDVKLNRKTVAMDINEIKLEPQLVDIVPKIVSRSCDRLNNDKAIKCVTCGKVYANAKCLKRHQIVHQSKPYCCDVCGFLCSRPESLKHHLRLHSGEKPYKCVTCEKSFLKRSMLNDHQLLHNDKDALCCKTCGKRFETRSSFKTHMLKHTDNKPYICETCGRTFARALHLQRHVLIHTGD